MSIVDALDKLEVRSELSCNGRRIIAFDWQAAALRRSGEVERCDDRGSSRFECSSQMPHVRVALLVPGKEMKKGAIVPDVDRNNAPITGHIGVNPGHMRRSASEPRPRASDGARRDIQDCHARQSPVEKMIHETRIPASDIDHSGRRTNTSAFQ